MAIDSLRKYLYTLIISLMALNVSGQEIIPEKLKNNYYHIDYLQLSPNGMHAAFNKIHHYSHDTVVLVDTQKQDVILLQFPGTSYSTFTKAGNFFAKNAKNAELVLLPSQKKIDWQGIAGGEYANELDLIAMMKEDVLSIIDGRGQVIRTVDGVRSIHKKDGSIYYVKKNGSEYVLYKLEKSSDIPIFQSRYEKLSVFQLSEHNYLVLEFAAGRYVVNFSDAAKNFQLKLQDTSGVEIAGFVDSPIQIGNDQIFLNLIVKTAPKDRSKVEVWYGNDNRIVEHTYKNDAENAFALWNPYTNKVVKLKGQEVTHFFTIGSERYLLAFDQFRHRDFTKKSSPYTLYRYDMVTQRQELLAITGSSVISDPTGKYLATYRDGSWWLINVETKKESKIPFNSSRKGYFSDDGQLLLFENENTLTEFDLKSGKLRHLALPTGYRSQAIIDNFNYYPISLGSTIYRARFVRSEKFYIHLWNRSENKSAVAAYFKGKLEMVIPPTADYIGHIGIKKETSDILYTLSNVHTPPQFWFKHKKVTLAYDSKKQDVGAKNIRSEMVTAFNSKGRQVIGVLIYPLDFDPTKKYPMVTSIYESQTYESNKYLFDGMFGSTEGVNSRYLIENGYFVFLPSIVYDERGAGFSALDCVEAQLDNLKKYAFIDFSKVALVGHSHGGYETNFLATKSERFATYVAGAGNSDLVRSFNSFNYNFSSPFYWQFEDGQYRMPGAFSEHKELYIKSSPVYHADQVTKPILLWAGKKDNNIVWDQSMEFYLALRRNHKKVAALFYPEDGHTINKTENRVDLYTRIYEWLDYFLKDKKDIPWIDRLDRSVELGR